MDTKRLGSLAERAAACFLAMNGYAIVALNYRFRGKEIDIVARDGRTIVFVEVKLRTTARRGLPREAVDERKRRHIIFAARGYLAEHGADDVPCRFDVVEVEVVRGGLSLRMEHLTAAFRAVG